MCGRYILVQNISFLEKRFNVVAPEGLIIEPNYNISPGTHALVIASDHPKELELMRFGMRPHWAKKPMYLINARAEGGKNKENDPLYAGSKEIFLKPAFRKPIRSQRCLVIADAFYEGTTKEKLSRPFLVYLKNKMRPFCFAGIWDTWVDQETGEEIRSFAIITTVPNTLLQRIPHHRSPVILAPEEEKLWLNRDLPLSDVLDMLKPFPASQMNAYPVSPSMKHPQSYGKDLIKPIGERLDPEFDTHLSLDLRLEGMGSRKDKPRK